MTGVAVVVGAGHADVVPALWTVLAVLMGCGAAVVAACSWQAERAVRRRTHSLTGRPERRSPSGSTEPEAGLRPVGATRRTGGGLRPRVRREGVLELATALGGVAFGVVVIGGAGGLLGGIAAGLAGCQWRRRARRAGHAAGEGLPAADVTAVERQLPLAAELMAACLTAGSGPAQAAEAVGRATAGPLGDRLVRVAAELRLGGEHVDVWGRFGSSPGCEELARCMERAGTAGVPPVQAVARLAAECRARRSRAAATRARRAAVQVTGPLGLCFLPAFLAVGVAPVVLGMARSLL